jgi:hypothetical protein
MLLVSVYDRLSDLMYIPELPTKDLVNGILTPCCFGFSSFALPSLTNFSWEDYLEK